MPRHDVPTCYTGWKQVTDDCPACGPLGPCQDTEEPGRVKPSAGLRFFHSRWREAARVLWLYVALLGFAVFVVRGLAALGEPQSLWLMELFGGH